MITSLKSIELKAINGGCPTSPDPDVQTGLNIGCAFGRILGNTVRQVKSILKIF
jgi:hypothetical protein